MSEHILVERPETHPGVLVIRFNRPDKKNAITEAMYHRITAALNEAQADDTVRAVAFLGTEGCFTAGNDMGDFLAYALSDGSKLPAAALVLRALVAAEKPLVSGVDGLAIGIGTTLNMHCDLTIASSRSLFKTPFVDLALVPEAASSLLAPLAMGHQRAFALLALGEGFSAEEARAAGLIWKVVEPDAVERETLALAANLAKKPPQALKIARDLLRGDRSLVLARLDEELAHFAAQLKSAEARAAFEAFLARK
ncbi:crotonase/enoyl-CoA hydratase family protein [Agrobacterium vitis]|uniref:Crotonase/enoyl-CoA hydratase family protein n=1 Tax=Agrobacterium vitis TaxID=373 RepID=A0AAE5AXL7_AGRVI|nr:crotonase/enoyl-CoA hydratase family protein [Agrobacterium vitis]MCF1499726.1 crotonase/enoyl-CoA hydratase family protein [Allorhizobium sp. Av2]MCM2440794.1 crotonase/enoyl-CoA hydratase family protein [Agrobacterium vitis]MUZ59227.1 crotonase/enoyl-CoA hydratase family protein [Agrobacterium vitis]MVA66876.1 crotonase/enoyl-CoA hydratase family protein [Agrobacterium vitis]MVA87319.1 crotonase/enoyl-CoA hydratase family protein [Agrobacterium vitis]